MSTLKVTNIENPAGGGVSAKIADVGGGQLSNRNLIHNGAMKIAQRGTSESGLTDSPAFVVDRFSYRRTGAWGTNSFTMSQQSSGAPGGFTHFLRLAQSGTAAAPPTDTSCSLSTIVEGFDTAQAGFGTSSAKDLTVTFYAKGSVAGTYCCFLINQAANQSYVAEYSLTTSWTRFEITIPARTTGTWLTDNGKGFEIHWIVAADSDSTTYSGSTGWNTANARWTSNQIETFASTSGATFDLTGVQLEVGSVATTFEHRSFGEELQKCKRYYQTVGSVFSGETEGADRFTINAEFKPEMRASPTCTVFTGRSARIRYAGSDVTITTPTLNNTSATIAGVWTRLTTSGRTNAKLVTGRGTGNIDSQFIQADAEL